VFVGWQSYSVIEEWVDLRHKWSVLVCFVWNELHAVPTWEVVKRTVWRVLEKNYLSIEICVLIIIKKRILMHFYSFHTMLPTSQLWWITNYKSVNKCNYLKCSRIETEILLYDFSPTCHSWPSILRNHGWVVESQRWNIYHPEDRKNPLCWYSSFDFCFFWLCLCSRDHRNTEVETACTLWIMCRIWRTMD